MKTYRQIKAIEQKNKQKILELCPYVNENSGIYAFTRDDGVIKYAYVGQAKHLLTRLAQHLAGYTQHIDLSIKKHGLYSEKNQTGWKIAFAEIEESELDMNEQLNIERYHKNGYQLLNKTKGGQGIGKTALMENKERKGYRQGLQRGYENAIKEVAKLFEKNLYFAIVKENKNTIKAFEKFKEFINIKENKND